MEDDIKEIVVKYISGREEVFAGSRSNWVKGRPNVILIKEHKDPPLKIYRNGKGYIFEHSQGLTEFGSIEELRKDKYWETIFDTYMED